MRNLTELLANPLFQSILKKTQYINQLDTILHTVLPSDLKKYCRVADIKSTCLILQVDNGAWATRLRYEAPQLLSALKTHRDFANIVSIRWQVQTQSSGNNATSSQPTPHKPVQSKIIKDLLVASSQAIKNEKLKASIERLASRV